jgi:oxygen-dependent protoporphyrinogen oxidase
MADAAHIAIVGGGITGLAAAHAALARGEERGRPVRVTVLERSARFGGNLVTERIDGYLLDGGPDSWVITKPQATALARALGLGDALVGTNSANRRFYVAWGDRLHPVPEGLVLGVPTKLGPLAASPLFSWRGKARMALEPFVPARRFEGDDDESIADFATRRLGREAAQRLVAPLLGGISAGDATDISVRAAFPQLVAMERERGSLVRGMRSAARERAKAQAQAGGKGTAGSAFVSLAGGVGQLVEALVEHLRARGVALRDGGGRGADPARRRLDAGPGGRRIRGGRCGRPRRSRPPGRGSRRAARHRGGASPVGNRLRIDRHGLPRLPPGRLRASTRRRRLRRAACSRAPHPRGHVGLEQVGRSRAAR